MKKPTSRSPWRAALGNTLLVLISVIFAVVGAEATFRALGLYTPPSRVPEPNRPDIFRGDETLGYRLWKSSAMCYRYPVDNPEIHPVNSNSDGFRSTREYGESDSRSHVVVVGDSFVFGMGVREEDRLTEVLESLEPTWRVHNMGMPGWGIDLMIRAIELLASKTQPDIVALAVYTDDFRRLLPYYAGTGYAIPKFELKDGKLLSVPYTHAIGWRRLRIAHAVYETYCGWGLRRNRFDLNEALLNRFLEMAEQHEFEPVVLFLPGKGWTKDDQARVNFLQDWATRKEVPFLDLTERIFDAGIDETYIEGNWHWNPRGHEIAAEELHRFLKEQFYSPKNVQLIATGEPN